MTPSHEPLSRDLRGAIVMRAVARLERVSTRASTSYAYLSAAAWGIRIGEGCRFYGLPLYRRQEGARVSIGDRCEFRSAQWANLFGINRRCTFAAYRPGAVLEIGSGCRFSGAALYCATSITIGDHVVIGPNVTITDSDSKTSEFKSLSAVENPLAVAIGADTFIGANSVILKGVTIGRGCVVAIGSIVTRSVPDGARVAGNPAKDMDSP